MPIKIFVKVCRFAQGGIYAFVVNGTNSVDYWYLQIHEELQEWFHPWLAYSLDESLF